MAKPAASDVVCEIEFQRGAARLPAPDEILLWRLSPKGVTTTRVSAVLAPLLGCDGLQWEIGAHGKPQLCQHALHTSWSHTRDVLLVALCLTGPVGVDIEAPRRLSEALMQRCFSATERAQCQSDSALALRFWCLKEAYVKATGRGIAAGLKQVDASTPLRFDAFARHFRIASFQAAVVCLVEPNRPLRLSALDLRYTSEA